MFKKLRSTITSKGQITLPKTVRDVMGLNTGDQVTCEVDSDMRLIIEKADEEKQTEVLLNLIEVLQRDNEPLVITGGIAIGKTFFVKLLLTRQLSQNIAILEDAHREYGQIIKQFEHISLIKAENTSKLVMELVNLNTDLLVIDEAQIVDPSFARAAYNIGVKVLLVTQHARLINMESYDSYFVLEMDKNKFSIDHYQQKDGKTIIKPIY